MSMRPSRGVASALGFIVGALVGYFAGVFFGLILSALLGFGGHDAGTIYFVIGFGIITPGVTGALGMYAARSWIASRERIVSTSFDGNEDK